jgi:hypothetical protein
VVLFIFYFLKKNRFLNFINLNSEINTSTILSHLYIREREKKN